MKEGTSLWVEISKRTKTYPKLVKDIEVDVAIVGGGITAITAACQLIEAGKRVAIVEAYKIGGVTLAIQRVIYMYLCNLFIKPLKRNLILKPQKRLRIHDKWQSVISKKMFEIRISNVILLEDPGIVIQVGKSSISLWIKRLKY